MNKIELLGDQVTISISGWDKLFSLKGELSFPKQSITKVSAYEDDISPPWLKVPGTAIPGVIVAGTYRNLHGRKEFWCTHFKGNTLVIDLDHENYSRIVCDLSAEQPVETWIARLQP
jgi:hypothetical protein